MRMTSLVSAFCTATGITSGQRAATLASLSKSSLSRLPSSSSFSSSFVISIPCREEFSDTEAYGQSSCAVRRPASNNGELAVRIHALLIEIGADADRGPRNIQLNTTFNGFLVKYRIETTHHFQSIAGVRKVWGTLKFWKCWQWTRLSEFYLGPAISTHSKEQEINIPHLVGNG